MSISARNTGTWAFFRTPFSTTSPWRIFLKPTELFYSIFLLFLEQQRAHKYYSLTKNQERTTLPSTTSNRQRARVKCKNVCQSNGVTRRRELESTSFVMSISARDTGTWAFFRTPFSTTSPWRIFLKPTELFYSIFLLFLEQQRAHKYYSLTKNQERTTLPSTTSNRQRARVKCKNVCQSNGVTRRRELESTSFVMSISARDTGTWAFFRTPFSTTSPCRIFLKPTGFD